MKVIKDIYTYSSKGLININELTMQDQVFTVRGRFQPIERLYYKPISLFASCKESLTVPLALNQAVFFNKENTAPKFIPPKEKNHDSRDPDFWYMVGFLLKNPQDIILFQKDTELYYFIKRLGSLYSPQFNLPINILTLQRNKLEAFISGLNLEENDLKQLNRKTKLTLVTLLQQLKFSFSTKNSINLSTPTLKHNIIPNTYVRCVDVTDGGYYVNGLYITTASQIVSP